MILILKSKSCPSLYDVTKEHAFDCFVNTKQNYEMFLLNEIMKRFYWTKLWNVSTERKLVYFPILYWMLSSLIENSSFINNSQCDSAIIIMIETLRSASEVCGGAELNSSGPIRSMHWLGSAHGPAYDACSVWGPWICKR